MKKPIAIDLFCGAGGLSEGFRQAGFNVVCGIEFNKDICETHRANFPEAATIEGDICDVTIEQIREESNIGEQDVDIVIGGFPCQGFSMAGKRIVDDPRNFLFKEFVRIVAGFMPKVFVAENVVGLVSMAEGQFVKEIKEEFGALGYEVEMKVLTASDYGVPQKRQRAIFIGNRIGQEINFPKPTHGEEEGLQPFVTVRDALSDLPPIPDGKGKDISTYIPRDNTPYQQYMRGQMDLEEYLSGETKDKPEEELVLHNHWTSKSREDTVARIALIEQGKNWSSLPEELKTKGKYSNLYLRFHPDFPAVTLTNIRKSMFIAPFENRLLSVREGARIQSFPDHMVFKGGLGSQQQQIGNAVPPLMGYAIAKQVLEDFFVA